MKRLPRLRLHRIYNQIDNRKVDVSDYNPVMLNKGIETYTYYSGLSNLSATDLNGLCNYGVEYNRVRLDRLGNSIPNTGIGNDQYVPSTHIPYIPSANFFATIPLDDWKQIVEAAYKSFTDSLDGQEGSSSISDKYDEDSYERKLVVDQIRSNTCDEVKTEKKVENKETVVYSETLEEFEKEYQAFIEMLKAQKAQKS